MAPVIDLIVDRCGHQGSVDRLVHPLWSSGYTTGTLPRLASILDQPANESGKPATLFRRTIQRTDEECIDAETATGSGEEKEHRKRDEHHVRPHPLVGNTEDA